MDLRCSILIVWLICQVSSSDDQHKNDVCNLLCQPAEYTSYYCTTFSKHDFTDSRTTPRGAIFLCCLGEPIHAQTVKRIKYLETREQSLYAIQLIYDGIADNATSSKLYAGCIRDCQLTDLQRPWTPKDIVDCVGTESQRHTGLCKYHPCS